MGSFTCTCIGYYSDSYTREQQLKVSSERLGNENKAPLSILIERFVCIVSSFKICCKMPVFTFLPSFECYRPGQADWFRIECHCPARGPGQESHHTDRETRGEGEQGSTESWEGQAEKTCQTGTGQYFLLSVSFVLATRKYLVSLVLQANFACIHRGRSRMFLLVRGALSFWAEKHKKGVPLTVRMSWQA